MAFKEKGNTDMVMRKEIIITDWDGVLQQIDKAWCYALLLARKDLEPYFDYSKLENYGYKDFILDLFNRKEYYLNKWLLRPEYNELPGELYRYFMGLYANNDHFYEGCDFLSMMDGIAGMSKQNFVKEIIILTQVPYSNGRDLRKEKIFEEKIKPIAPDKFKLVQLKNNESKADWIKENKPDFTVFIDDRAEIIMEVVQKCEIFEKIFYMPMYGYNEFLIENEEFIKAVDRRGAQFSVFPVQIITTSPEDIIDLEKEQKELLKNLGIRK